MLSLHSISNECQADRKYHTWNMLYHGKSAFAPSICKWPKSQSSIQHTIKVQRMNPIIFKLFQFHRSFRDSRHSNQIKSEKRPKSNGRPSAFTVRTNEARNKTRTFPNHINQKAKQNRIGNAAPAYSIASLLDIREQNGINQTAFVRFVRASINPPTGPLKCRTHWRQCENSKNKRATFVQ